MLGQKRVKRKIAYEETLLYEISLHDSAEQIKLKKNGMKKPSELMLKLEKIGESS